MAQDEQAVYYIDSSSGFDWFKSIAPDQPFYVSEDGKLVISFNEGDVGIASMGPVSFVIPTGSMVDILAEGTLVR